MILVQLVTPPATEPVTLGEAKAQIRVDSSDEDALIDAAVAAAVDHVQAKTRRQLEPATFRLVLERFPCGAIRLPRAPLIEVLKVEFLNAAGELEELPAGAYAVEGVGTLGAIVPLAAWPVSLERSGAVRIEFRAGYTAAFGGVPPALRQAVLLMLGHFYDSREASAAPPAVEWLLDSFKVWR